MIFATDLDRTLIFNERHLEGYIGNTIGIEYFKERMISYISQYGMELLESVIEKTLFIPITTRNKEQYQRLTLWETSNRPRWYVVNNGGTIYHDHEEDVEWTEQIRAEISKLPLDYDEALELFIETYQGKVERYKKSDDLIWVVLADEKDMDWVNIGRIEQQLRANKWRIEVTGRKIYLYPGCVNKGAALEYIKNQLQAQKVMAAGDSWLDKEMLDVADVAWIPKGADLERMLPIEGRIEKLIITEKSGLKGTEEILEQVLLQVVKG